MPSILVVEHEGRYIERIRGALAAEGWSPRFVAGRPEALRAAASEAPHLVLVNAELPGAAELLRGFGRRFGGPGSVALVAEQRTPGTGSDREADEVLAKPFSDQDLRLAVRRVMAAAKGGGAAADAPPPAEPERQLTSQDIFGDLLAEVEGEEAGAGGEELFGGPARAA
ncbi:MAG TPA: hypothetical protein VHQ65_01065, partial [Thermoanaerobaculia bacterium]|nr:hypothetical protein [Thermoanaerobaculia bacterium]